MECRRKEMFIKEWRNWNGCIHPPDYSVVYNHLDLMLDLPWNEYTEDSYDLNKQKRSWTMTTMGWIRSKNASWNTWPY